VVEGDAPDGMHALGQSLAGEDLVGVRIVVFQMVDDSRDVEAQDEKMGAGVEKRQ
jgi:hypothetical protein